MSPYVLLILMSIGRGGQFQAIDMPSKGACERERDFLADQLKKDHGHDLRGIYCIKRTEEWE
jgi:hypothetical protein